MNRTMRGQLVRLGGYLELTQGQCLCLLLVVAGTLGDVATTAWGSVVIGTRELNPFTQAMMDHFGLYGYFIIKLVVVVSATLFLLRLVNRFLTNHPKRPGHKTIADLTLFVSGSGGVVLLGTSTLNLIEGAYMWMRLHG